MNQQDIVTIRITEQLAYDELINWLASYCPILPMDDMIVRFVGEMNQQNSTGNFASMVLNACALTSEDLSHLQGLLHRMREMVLFALSKHGIAHYSTLHLNIRGTVLLLTVV